MSLADATNVSQNPDFQQRVLGAIVKAAQNVFAEVTNEVQTLSVSGSPTGGSFTLSGLPGPFVTTMNGTTTNASASVTGLPSTAGLFVGMTVTGNGVPVNATIASITSTTALTLSANATASATVALTFSGTPTAVVAFNASAGDVQDTLQQLANIGTGNVVCTGGPLPGTPVVITFCGTLGNSPQKLLTIAANNLTGGSSPAPSLAHTTVGVSFPVHIARQALAGKILAAPAVYQVLFGIGAAVNATVQADYPAPNYTLAVSAATADNDVQFVVNSIYGNYV